MSTPIIKYLKLIIGGFAFAAGFQFFLLPNEIIIGGVSGLSMIIYHLTGFPPGIMIFIGNLPLFFLAWRLLGLRFIAFASLGVLISSLAVDGFALLNVSVTADPLLASIYGGAISGAGVGLIMSAGATTGGSDLAARMLRTRRPDISAGRFIMLIDGAVILLGAFILRRHDAAMYALFSAVISNRVVDLILYGANYAKVMHIITEEGAAISSSIIEKKQRGVTIIPATGGYTGTNKSVLLCAIRQTQQIAGLTQIVRDIDPNAFIIIHDAREIHGLGFQASADIPQTIKREKKHHGER